MNYKNLFDLLSEYFDEKRCFKYVKGINSTDRFFDFAAFKETADYCAKQMINAGLSEVEILPLKADGKTVYGDWVIPQAWDANEGILKIVNPYVEDAVLADYQKIPCSLVMYSAPTAAQGVEAEVIIVEDPEKTQGVDMRGKLLFTHLRQNMLVDIAAIGGAVGIISDFFPMYKSVRNSREDVYDASRWENAFMAPVNDSDLFAFSLSPRNGDRLRRIIADADPKGEKVVLHAKVDTKLYDGEAYTVSSVLYGEDPQGEEMMIFGHLYEPGAHDNASGCGLILEIATALQKAINEGKLPKPKRNIRFGMGFECGGSMGYCQTHPDKISRTIGGFVADMVGTEAIDRTELCYWHNPYANWSYLDTAILQINSEYMSYCGRKHPFTDKAFSIGTDNILSDPCFGMPSVAMITEPALSYHSSMDTIDRIDPSILKRNGIMIGTYMYYFAYAGAKEVQCMFAPIKADMQRKIDLLEDKNGLEAYLIGEAFYRAALSLKELVKDDEDVKVSIERTANDLLKLPKPEILSKPCEKIMNEGGALIPKRLVMGCLNFEASPQLKDFDRIELQELEWHPAWNSDLNIPLFWTDGKKNLWEISVLSAIELGKENIEGYFYNMIRYFKFLGEHSFIKWINSK